MFQSLGDVLGTAPSSRAKTPVHRNSRPAGRCEGVFWRRTNRQEVRQIVLAARRYELQGRAAGSRNGPLGTIALEILDLLANMVDYRSGRLDPSLETLMRRLKRSKDAIVRGLKALRTHGFLDWLRRFEEIGTQGRGPQVRQVSNAYRLSLPARALRLLGRAFQAAPPPDDYTHAIAEHRAKVEAYRASLSCEQMALFELGDDELGRALARLGQMIDQRESAKQTESKTTFISI